MGRGEDVPSEFVKSVLYAHLDVLYSALSESLVGGRRMDERVLGEQTSVSHLQQMLDRKAEQIRVLRGILDKEQKVVRSLADDLKAHEDMLIEMSRLLTAVVKNRHLIMIPEVDTPGELMNWTERARKVLRDYEEETRH